MGASFLRIQRDDSRFSTTYFENEPATIAGLQQDRSHRLPRAVPVVPVGVGLRYRLSEKLALHTEASYRVMSTDYLDGFSQAANPASGDHYSHYSIGLRFVLGAKSKYDCPDVR